MNRKVMIVGAALVVCASLFAGCKPKYPACKKDAHCKEGEYCVNNLCQQCRDTGDCPEGQECQDGACREIPGYCKSSADCAEGQVCRDNRCGPCMSNSDCAEGLVCIDGACGKAECQSNEDCPAGLSCVNYRCKVVEQVSSAATEDCQLEPIYFDFDSSELSSSARDTVERNYDCFKKRGMDKLTVEGHCDPRGTTEYNMGLGDRRARIVTKIITTLGADKANLRVVSKGEEEATGTNEEGWAKDRRAEFR